jgi:hypothetical protein
MPDYIIECETTGREVYQISAPTEDEARRILYQEAPTPVVSEVMSFGVTSIKEEK